MTHFFVTVTVLTLQIDNYHPCVSAKGSLVHQSPAMRNVQGKAEPQGFIVYSVTLHLLFSQN